MCNIYIWRRNSKFPKCHQVSPSEKLFPGYDDDDDDDDDDDPQMLFLYTDIYIYSYKLLEFGVPRTDESNTAVHVVASKRNLFFHPFVTFI